MNFRTFSVLIVLTLLFFSIVGASRADYSSKLEVKFSEIGESSDISLDGDDVNIKLEDASEAETVISIGDKKIIIQQGEKKEIVIGGKEIILEKIDIPNDIDLPDKIDKKKAIIEIKEKKEFVDLGFGGIKNNEDEIIMKICNLGTVPSPSLDNGLLFEFDNGFSEFKKIENIMNGDCASFTYIINDDKTNDAKNVKITIDNDNGLNDPFRSNNYWKLPLIKKSVEPTSDLPDLVISDVQIYPKNPKPQSNIFLAVKIKNIGDTPAKVSWEENGANWVMSTNIYLNGESIAFLRPVHPDVTYIEVEDEETGEIQIQAGSFNYPDFTVNPGEEIGLSTPIKLLGQSGQSLKVGVNELKVVLDELYINQPESGIITESDEENNVLKTSFIVEESYGFDTYSYFPICQRIGDDYFIATQLNVNGQPFYADKQDYKTAVSYLFLSDDSFYLAEQPEPLFDSITLYESLFTGADSVEDNNGKKYKIFNRLFEGNIDNGQAIRVDVLGTKIIGVTTTVHTPTGNTHQSLFAQNLKPYGKADACSGGTIVRMRAEEFERWGDKFGFEKDTKLKNSIKLDESDDGFVQKFINWVKKLFG
jgi:hypothetical protein